MHQTGTIPHPNNYLKKQQNKKKKKKKKQKQKQQLNDFHHQAHISNWQIDSYSNHPASWAVVVQLDPS